VFETRTPLNRQRETVRCPKGSTLPVIYDASAAPVLLARCLRPTYQASGQRRAILIFGVACTASTQRIKASVLLGSWRFQQCLSSSLSGSRPTSIRIYAPGLGWETRSVQNCTGHCCSLRE